MANTPRTIETKNAFLHLPAASVDGRIPTIVFFITGNPGLIGYYHEFLNLLCQQSNPSRPASSTTESELTSKTSTTSNRFVVAGFSLGGFDIPLQTRSASSKSVPSSSSSTSETNTAKLEIEDVTEPDDLDAIQYPSGMERKEIYGLRDQIDLCYARLHALLSKVKSEYIIPSTENTAPERENARRNEDPTIKVILIGHSVGAYIALELVRLHHEHHMDQYQHTPPLEPPTTSSSPTPTHPFQISQSILLTPTVLNISHSPSGRLATPLLSTLPFLPHLAQLGTRTLSSLIPTATLRWLVARVTGMPEGSDALGTTVEFLGCEGAVRQALVLAGEEMRFIGENRWGREIWGVIDGGTGDGSDGGGGGVLGGGGGVLGGGGGGGWTVPKLCFWFAREDHWVADKTREEIVEIVGRGNGGGEGGRAEVVVDEDEGLVHAWCIEQNELVARRVRVWLGQGLD